MQYVSCHSSAARLSQRRAEMLPRTHAFAGLPSLPSDDFSFRAAPRLTPTAAPVRLARRTARPMDRIGTIVALAIGSTLGLSLGTLVCSAIVG